MSSVPASPILELHDVCVHFPVAHSPFEKAGVPKVLRAVDGVSFQVNPGEVLGLVGESGCGKSTVARAIMRLVDTTSGRILYEGQNLTTADEKTVFKYRRHLQMVFQDPYASLNPRMTISDTLAEPLIVHQLCTREAIPSRIGELMRLVGLDPRMQRKYPHEFSGGQRQRIAIARALAVNPRVLVADEPVSALDVSIQAQIVNLLHRLVRELGIALVFIAHDLSVVKHISDRVAVMYLGRIVEEGPAEFVITAPKHPYTQALVQAVPHPFPEEKSARHFLPPNGEPPSPLAPPSGCPFHPRCPRAELRCRSEKPLLKELQERPIWKSACLLDAEVSTS